MRKLFKERKLFKGGNYMRKYGILFGDFNCIFNKNPISIDIADCISKALFLL